MDSHPMQWYVVDLRGSSLAWLPQPGRWSAVRISRPEKVAKHIKSARRGAVWIAASGSDLTLFTQVVVVPKHGSRLLVLGHVNEVSHHVLSALFEHVVIAHDEIKTLPLPILAEALAAPNRKELLVAGAADKAAGTVVLYNGDLDPIVVPLAWFESHGGGVRADADDFDIVDYGHGVRLGGLEASTDAILYEFDRGYRRKARALALEVDRSLGGSIRRLRLQRGLPRGAFGSIDEKTIARIERNEVRTPRASTLEAIADVLGVEVEELGGY